MGPRYPLVLLPSAGDLGAGPLAVAAGTLFSRNPDPVSALAVAEAEVWLWWLW